MEMKAKEKSIKHGEVETLLDQIRRLTTEKLDLLSKHEKELLGKNIVIKQLEEKAWNLGINL